jgi:NPCBM/NEW2 domain/Carbohydrate esterase, sialic acid-specific acetylesterase
MKYITTAKAAVLLLCLNVSTTIAQTERFTFPVQGSVFQKVNNQHELYFGGQALETKQLYYRIRKMNGTTWSNSTIIANDVPISLYALGNTGRKGFYKKHGNLPEGWYNLQLYRKGLLGIKHICNNTDFGVGDIYFIAGQSNAQGYLGGNEDDNPSPSWSFTQNTKVRIYKENGTATTNNISKGLPYKYQFDAFENGQQDLTPSYGVYPNGVASWCWSSLGKKIADGGTPVMFFNNALGGTSVNTDWTIKNPVNGIVTPNNLMQKFSETIKMYGNIFGAKAVLWHQGERDSQILTLSTTNKQSYLNDYETGLKNIIQWSRNALSSSGTNLSWYVSQVSYTTGSNDNVGYGIGPDRGTPSFNYFPSCTSSDAKIKDRNTNLIGKQGGLINHSNKIYLGISSDDIHTSTTNDINKTECARASNWRIHFSSKAASETVNSLEILANRWKQALDASKFSVSPNTNIAVPATALIKLENVTGSATNYTLTVTNQGAGSTYYWVKNDAGIANAAQITTTNSYAFTGVVAGDFLSCYVLKPDGRLAASQPFITPGGTADVKKVELPTGSLSFSSAVETKTASVVSQNVDWDITNVPNWASVTINEDESSLIITPQQNTTGSSRTAQITVQEIGGSLNASLNITQAAAGGTTTPLSSLTPLSVYMPDWGTLQTNKSVVGNSLRIGGVTYASGLGTHASSNIKYNLGG